MGVKGESENAKGQSISARMSDRLVRPLSTILRLPAAAKSQKLSD